MPPLSSRAVLFAVLLAGTSVAQENLFLPTPSSVAWPMGASGPKYAAFGELNGDGRIDAVATSNGLNSAQLTTHLGDGFGRFGPAVATIAAPSGRAAIADFDADGDTDVVAIDSNSMNALVYLGDGTGALQLGVVASLSHHASALRVADVDVDGDPDLVTAGIFFGNVARWDVAWNTGGGFTLTTHALSVPGPMPDAFALEVATLDADAFPDVIVGPSAGTLEVWHGSASGAFTQGVSLALPLANDARAVIAADLDGDGDRDVVAGDAATTVSVFANSGVGTFAPALSLLPLAPTATAHTFEVDDADRDGDGDLLVFSTLGLSLARNDGGLVFTQFGPTASALSKYADVTLIDVNGDHRSDVLAHSPITNGFVTAIATGAAVFDLPPPPSPTTTYTSVARVTDADVDGDLDVLGYVSSNATLTTYANDGTGAFSAFAATNLSSSLFDAGDVDGDGDPDLVFIDIFQTAGSMRWRAGNATGAFAPSASGSVGLGSGSSFVLACADVDLDGRVEGAYGVSPAARVGVIWLGAGTPPPTQSWVSIPTAIGPSQILLDDVLGDARLELVVPAKLFAGLHVFTQNGLQSFLTTSQIVPVSGAPLMSRAGDVNADAVTDLVALIKVGLNFEASTALGLGAGTFAAPTSLPLGVSLTVPSFVIADVDDDGAADAVFVASPPHGLNVSFGGPGGLPAPFVHDVGTYLYLADVGSCDVDPQNEIMLMRDGDPAPVLLQPRCRGGAAPIGRACVGTGGFAPGFSLLGCVEGGSTVTLGIHDAPGGSVALVVFGLAPTFTPFSSACALQVTSVLPAQFLFALTGAGPGNGEFAIPLVVPAAAPLGSFAMQAIVADPTLAVGFTTTHALEVIVR